MGMETNPTKNRINLLIMSFLDQFENNILTYILKNRNSTLNYF